MVTTLDCSRGSTFTSSAATGRLIGHATSSARPAAPRPSPEGAESAFRNRHALWRAVALGQIGCPVLYGSAAPGSQLTAQGTPLFARGPRTALGALAERAKVAPFARGSKGPQAAFDRQETAEGHSANKKRPSEALGLQQSLKTPVSAALLR